MHLLLLRAAPGRPQRLCARFGRGLMTCDFIILAASLRSVDRTARGRYLTRREASALVRARARPYARARLAPRVGPRALRCVI